MDLKNFKNYFSEMVMMTLNEQDPRVDKQNLDYPQQPDQAGEVPTDPDPGTQLPPGMGGLEQEYNKVEIGIGRAYELKKIYSKLIAISNVMDHYSGESFDSIRSDILQALDLFHVVCLNLDKFENRIDEIIVDFYRFIKKSIHKVESSLENRNEY